MSKVELSALSVSDGDTLSSSKRLSSNSVHLVVVFSRDSKVDLRLTIAKEFAGNPAMYSCVIEVLPFGEPFTATSFFDSSCTCRVWSASSHAVLGFVTLPPIEKRKGLLYRGVCEMKRDGNSGIFENPFCMSSWATISTSSWSEPSYSLEASLRLGLDRGFIFLDKSLGAGEARPLVTCKEPSLRPPRKTRSDGVSVLTNGGGTGLRRRAVSRFSASNSLPNPPSGKIGLT